MQVTGQILHILLDVVKISSAISFRTFCMVSFFTQKLTRVGGSGNTTKISVAICSKSNNTMLKHMYAYYYLPAQTQYFKKFHSRLVLLLLLRERHSYVRPAVGSA